MPVTQRQIAILAPYLEGDHPTHNNVDRETGETTREWNLKCPLHEDSTRSASLNVDKGLFWCARCGGMPVTALLRRKEEWYAPGGRANGKQPNLNGSAPDKPRRTLTEGMLAGWHSALMSNTSGLQWLRERRGLNKETLVQYQIGMEDKRLFTIPVRSPDNDIWNVRFYNPNPRGSSRKIWSESGYGSPNRLFPMSILVSDPEAISILGGEWDTLLTIQNLYAAITRTGAEDVWLAEWGQHLKDKIVYLGHDKDEKGLHANRVVGRALSRIADCRVIDWPYDYVEKHGKDATDFFLDHMPEDYQGLLDEAKPFGKRAVEQKLDPITDVTSVVDTFDAKKVGRPRKVIVTIKGRKEPGYTVPQRVTLACTQDAGTKCAICPMRAASGEAKVEITADDPLVLQMIDVPNSEVSKTIADSYGVPGGKCVKLVQEVEEYQGVEVLFARPALDYTDGAERDPEKAGMYKTLRITSVGRHNTPPNNTVEIIGALQPNPKTQGNEFLAHSLQVLETSVDRFELDAPTIKLLKRFQSARPLHKLAEINKALAEHVTRVHGRPEMHALMDLVFHSVLSFEFAGDLVHRGWLDALIVGDTRTGKSQAAERLIRHYKGGEIISCEAASFAGVIGGLQQMGGRDWAVTWGVVPQNDSRIVVLDEIGGLTTEEIAQMSDVRSSGQAKLIKIQQEITWARCRLLIMGNPRNATMANYTYGVDAIKPLIGNAEDIARFDLAMAVTLFDVPAETINQPVTGGELRYTTEACHALLMWAWTRRAEHVKFTKAAEKRVFDLANELGKLYVEDPPLVQAANIRIKICRIAVALAARTFSTDETYQKVLVTETHIEDAVRFINLLYGMTAFGYRERSKEQLGDRLLAEQNKDKMAQYLKGRPTLAKFLRTTGKFRRQDLDEIMSLSKEEANAIISTLYEARMVRKVLGDIVVEPTLHALLREVKW